MIGTHIYRNVEAGRAAQNDFVEAKNTVNLHQRWAQLVQTLSAGNPSLRPFANEPRVTDPTWQFMRLREAGDVFFGQSIASRGRENEAPVLRTLRERYVGDLTKGAIRVRFSSHEKAFAYRLLADGPKRSAPYFVASCDRGHYGLTDTNESTWIARGMVDSQNKGVGNFPVRAQGLLLYHFPIFGLAEDLDTRGSILMYLQGMYGSPDAASAVARDVDL